MSAPCNTSRVVPYPTSGPGYAYDAATEIPGASLVGSKRAVTPEQCMLACEASAPGCTSFFYNANLRRCHLMACPVGGWTCVHDDGLQSLSGSGLGPWAFYKSAAREGNDCVPGPNPAAQALLARTG